MLIGVLFMLILAACAIAAVIAIAMAVVITSRGRSHDSLYCGKCGYSATGLPDNRCPECGGDFADVGFVDRPPGRNWRAALLVAGWAILSPFAFFVLAISILVNAPHYVLKQDFERWHGPKSGAYESVHLVHNATSRTGWANPSPTLTQSVWQATFESRAALLDIRGDMLSGTITVSDGGTKRTVEGSLSEALLYDLLVGAYPDADAELLALEAREMHDRLVYRINPSLIEPLPASFDHIGNHGWSNWRTPDSAYRIGTFALFALLWLLGIILIARWARRRPVQS